MIDFLLAVLGVVLVAVALYFVAVVVFGPGEPAPQDREPDATPLPDRPLDADDLRALTLPVAVRGYRMADVDALLARLAEQLDSARRPAAEYPPVEDESFAPPSTPIGSAADDTERHRAPFAEGSADRAEPTPGTPVTRATDSLG